MTRHTVALLQNLFFSENKPAELRPLDLALLTYLILRQTEDHSIFDSKLTLANRLGCERKAIADSIKRLNRLGWIVSRAPLQWSPNTKRRTRSIGKTVALSLNLAKLPKSADKAKHSQPSPEAVTLAGKHTAHLIKSSLRKKQHKHFDRQQEHAAQRLIERMGGYEEARSLVNFALQDERFQNAARKSLYELRTRLSTLKRAYDAAQCAVATSSGPA